MRNVKRSIIMVIIMVMIISGISFYFYNKSGSVITITRLIEKVEKNNISGLELSDEEIDSIKEMFAFSDENKLDRPTVKLNKIHTSTDEEQILAAFELFEYDSDNQIRGIYVGYLSFTLKKESLFKWRVLEVKTIDNMKKQL